MAVVAGPLEERGNQKVSEMKGGREQKDLSTSEPFSRCIWLDIGVKPT